MTQFQTVNFNYPNIKEISQDPPVYIIENFLDFEKCLDLIEQSKNSMIPAPVVGKGNGEVSTARTSSTCYISREDVPSIVQQVSELLMNKSISHIELPQVGRYYKNEQYQAHFDAFDLNTEDGQRFAKNGGQRICTVLIYLNNVEKGGHTYFPELGLDIQPKQGTALVFFPANLDGILDSRALHAALPADDMKWVCQVWVRQFEYNGVPSLILNKKI